MHTKEKIKQAKRNILLNEELLGKYSTAREIFNNAEKILKGKKVTIRLVNIPEIKNLDNPKISELKKLANQIFNKYHTENTFKNNDSIIVVTKHGIEESVEKMYYNRLQRELCSLHLLIFSKLGKIIENAILVNQTWERKNRQDLLYWNYYLDSIIINGKKYFIEFDVRSINTKDNQYRIHRLELK